MSNLLIAIRHIIHNPVLKLNSSNRNSNRANSMGDALETYIKDTFCNSFHNTNRQKDKIYNEHFSYLGNQNNPPDIILKNGDGIEVKKIQTLSSALALNSSFPKNKLYSDDSRITEACRNCEDNNWTVKDIIYTVGVSLKKTNTIKAIWFVYGDCYAADRKVYSKISSKIKSGILDIPDVELTETNELASVKKVDPLGITNLRVRGMWHIQNPIRVFSDYINFDDSKEFSLHAIMLKDKYLSFPREDRDVLEQIIDPNFTIKDIKIKSPNNPAKLLKAKLISYAK